MKIKVIEEIIYDLITSSIFDHEQLMAQINGMLKRIGVQTGADRSYVFLASSNKNIALYTNEWCRPGARSDIKHQHHLKISDYPWIDEEIISNRDVIINKVSDLPKKALVDKKSLESQHLKSLILVPIKFKEEIIGLLGCECDRTERNWSKEDLELLKIVASLIGGLVKREQLQQIELNKILTIPGIMSSEKRDSVLATQSKYIKKELHDFFSSYPTVTFKNGGNIIHPGEKRNYYYYGEEGFLRSYSVTLKGQEITRNIFNPLLFFCHSFFLIDCCKGSYVESMSNNITLWKAPREEVVAFFMYRSALLFQMYNIFITDYTDYSHHIEALVLAPAKRRILVVLINLVRRFGEDVQGRRRISIKLTHRILASLTGLTRETVTNQMLLLSKEKILDSSSGFIVINNIDVLQKEMDILD